MNTNINIAYYKQEDWKRFISLAIDRENLHDNWEDWHQSFSQAKLHMAKQGFLINEIIIDLDDLIKYCDLHKLENSGKTRSQYVAQL